MYFTKPSFSIACLIALAPNVHAGGIYLSEIGHTDLGLASAGMAARAQDATVLASNPAGLARVEGRSFNAALQSLYGESEFQIEQGQNSGNLLGFIPGGSVFYSQQLNDKWTLGIGMYGNYGLALKYSNMPINSVLVQSFTIAPSASYRINDQWSLGLSINTQIGIFGIDVDGPDIDIDIEEIDVAFNSKVGALYELSEQTRFGLAYSSETTLEFEDKQMPLDSLMPQQVVFSAYHEVNDRLAIMGNLNWQDWSEFAPVSAVETQDTYHIAIGTQYKLNKLTTWNFGAAYDSSMLKSQSNGDLTLPTGKNIRISTGFDYQLDSEDTIGIALGVTHVEASQVAGAGEFDDSLLYFLSFNYAWAGK